jgi:chromosome segregation ATPase
LETSGEEPLFDEPSGGFLAPPGTYTATMYKQVNGKVEKLSKTEQFEVVRLKKGALPGARPADVADFWRKYEDAVRLASALDLAFSNAMAKVEGMKLALANSTADAGDIDKRIHDLRMEILELEGKVSGYQSKNEPGEKKKPTISDRLFSVSRGVGQSTYGPTETNRQSLEIAMDQLAEAKRDLESAQKKMSKLAQDLLEAGAPWMEGEPLPRR